MTREELINIIEYSENRATCPVLNCHEFTGKDGCTKCAENQLAEYERQIYNKGFNDGVARQRLNCDDCFYKLSLESIEYEKQIRDTAINDVLERVKQHYKFYRTMPSITFFEEMLGELKGE